VDQGLSSSSELSAQIFCTTPSFARGVYSLVFYSVRYKFILTFQDPCLQCKGNPSWTYPQWHSGTACGIWK